MNISYRWLQSLAPALTASPRAVADRLARLGAPVDEVVDLSAGIDGVVIARVDEVRPHPNADRLRLCTVDAGTGQALQVVCGASNVEAGRFYPFAPVGSTLPGGVPIRKAKLRGEVSEGMLCSARELGLGRDHAGLMALAGEWEAGAPLVESLGLDDARLLVDVTPNRPDLLSHLGIAREVVPGGAAGVELPRFPNAPEIVAELRRGERNGTVGEVRVTIEDADGCPRYATAIVRGVRVGPSPEWLASRLRAVGVRTINNVVDATNYVLFELGQPLHAFDLRRLGGGEVRIRRAGSGETLRTLDGIERTLEAGMLVIADAERPVALAGVMGGEESEVATDTTELLLECALFDPRAVRQTARRLGLSTDASYRFERGVDPEGQPRALWRVVELIGAVASGSPVSDLLDLNPVPFTRRSVELRPERAEHVLGVPLAPAEIAANLEQIGIEVDASASPLRVTVPGFRPDLTREIDLIEEVARRRGYDSFPDELRAWRPGTVPEEPALAVQRRAREVLVQWGFLEAQTPPFAPAATDRVPLLYPLSAEESHLRDSLTAGLLRRVEHNWAHGNRDVRLFEIGTVFFPGGDGGIPAEEIRLAAAFAGARRPLHWTGEAGSWDVWDLKGLLEELGEALGLGSVVPGEFTPLAPLTRKAERLRLLGPDGESVGGGGRAVAVDAPPWAGSVWIIEIVLPRVAVARAAHFRALPEFPAAERDLALLVPAGVSAHELREVVGERVGGLIEDLFPFDEFTGKGIPEGTRSLAWRLRFRRPDRTLTDAEVDSVVDGVLRALEERLGVRRR